MAEALIRWNGLITSMAPIREPDQRILIHF